MLVLALSWLESKHKLVVLTVLKKIEGLDRSRLVSVGLRAQVKKMMCIKIFAGHGREGLCAGDVRLDFTS